MTWHQTDRFFQGSGLAFLLLFLALLSGCKQPPLLERIEERGILRIATVAGPLTCYLDEKGPAGLEYELARRFAHTLAAKADFRLYPTRLAALEALKRGEVQMVAAARQPSSLDRERYRLSAPWYSTPLGFASTMGKLPLKSLTKPPEEPVAVPSGSLQQELLQSMAPTLPVEVLANLAEETILDEVNRGDLAHTLVNRALLRAWKSYYPLLVEGRKLSEPRGFHWYFSRLHDTSLETAANRYLEAQAANGTLPKLVQRYITDLPRRNFVTLRDFWKHVEERLPRYEELFRKAERNTGINWRLLAAVGYQESHWQPRAVSPTGVRGIMMLTRDAARKEKIGNRADPAQSIAGGARHLRWMEKRIPARIREPDRLWLTLASYNIGYGHLKDARVLTQRGGGNPDRWEDVKKFLPLLSRKKYYSTVKHGKARGGEPVVYVKNIRYFYRLLVWWDNRRNRLDCTSGGYPRLALKNARSSSPQSPASNPPSTAVK